MRGRKPAAIVSGTSTVDQVSKPPAWLSKDAKAEWRRTAAIMVERKTLTEGDYPALEGYCVAAATIKECQRTIDRDGMFILDARGQTKRHPAAGVMDAALKTLRLFACELGLTPVSRSRPSIREDGREGDENPFNI